MNITLAPEFRARLLKQIAEREFSERQGIHCTDLIYCLNKQAMRKLNPEPTSDQEVLLFSLGWATQRWLTGQDKDIPEKTVDGITVTLDALSPSVCVAGHKGIKEHDCGVPHCWSPVVFGNEPWELKATFQSANRPIEENIHWIRQLMAQCYVTGTTTTYLTRLEIMGDWGSIFPKGSSKEEKATYKVAHPKPTLTAYQVEFTKDELDTFWKWLVERGQLFGGILETGKLLPPALALASGMSFECGYCGDSRRKCCKEGKVNG